MTQILDNPAADTLPGGAFTTSRATLVTALDTVGTAIATRPSVPVLGGVLMESHGADLRVSGFDYETTITVTIADVVDTPGRMLLSHRELSKLLKALTQGLNKKAADRLPVTVAACDASCATVTLAETTMPVTVLPLEDYPTLPTEPEVFATVDGASFAAEVKRVLPAIGREDTLPALTGVRIEPTVSGDGLVVAGSDRYRLAVGHVRGSIVDDIAPAVGVLVNGATLGKILPWLGSQVSIGYGPTAFCEVVSLVSGPVSVITRLHNNNVFIEPGADYSSFLPATTVTVDRADLLTYTQRAAGVMAAKEVTGLSVILTVGSGSVSVAPTVPEGTEHLSMPEMPATTAGADAVLGLKPTFLAEALRTFTGSTLTLHIPSPFKPVLLTDTPDGLSDPTAYRHLLMPVRVS